MVTLTPHISLLKQEVQAYNKKFDEEHIHEPVSGSVLNWKLHNVNGTYDQAYRYHRVTKGIVSALGTLATTATLAAAYTGTIGHEHNTPIREELAPLKEQRQLLQEKHDAHKETHFIYTQNNLEQEAQHAQEQMNILNPQIEAFNTEIGQLEDKLIGLGQTNNGMSIALGIVAGILAYRTTKSIYTFLRHGKITRRNGTMEDFLGK